MQIYLGMMPYQKKGIPMLAGKDNFVFLTSSQGQNEFWEKSPPCG